MTRRPCRPAERATDREIGVVAAVLATGSEKAAAHRLSLAPDQIGAILAVTAVILGLITRSRVSPAS